MVICIDIFDVRYMTLDLADRPVVVSKRARDQEYYEPAGQLVRELSPV